MDPRTHRPVWIGAGGANVKLRKRCRGRWDGSLEDSEPDPEPEPAAHLGKRRHSRSWRSSSDKPAPTDDRRKQLGWKNAASKADWCRWSRSALKSRDGTPESAPSWHPGRFQSAFPACCSYLTHFLACPRTRFWFSLDQKPSPTERGREGRGGGDGTNQNQMLGHV